MWIDQRHLKVKSYEKRQLNLDYHLLRSFAFQSKCCIIKKVSYQTGIIIKQKALFI